MISVARSARPRRSPNRITLVNPDGSPVRSAESWPDWTDDYRWEPTDRIVGTDSMGADVFESDCIPEPDAPDGEALWAQSFIESSLPPVETDAEFLARLEAEEAAERDRVLSTYHPLPEDLAEYAAWSEALDNGTLPPEIAGRFTFGCMSGAPRDRDEEDAVRRCQVSPDELAMLAAGMAI